MTVDLSAGGELMGCGSLGIVFFPAFDWGISPTHPEREERLLFTLDQLSEEGVFDLPGVTVHNPMRAVDQDIYRPHFCLPDLDAVCPEPHRIAAGGAITAGRLVMEKESAKAFALVRPPGHHALRVVSSGRGFCQINTEAVMIERLRKDYGKLRVAVIDTDCHHGDGTQDIYWHDPDTLFISIHQDGRTLYPGSGFTTELGGPNARGRTLNVPLPPGSGDQAFLYVVDTLIVPILADFKPDLVINSAGQDNHYTDPITSMRLSAQGYAELNRRLNPDIAVLEGGYSIQGALPYVNLGIVLSMAGQDYSHVREPDFAVSKSGGNTGLEEAKRLCGPLLRAYFTPPPLSLEDGIEQAGTFVSEKHVYYDTSGERERLRETLFLCENCSGTVFIESVSTMNPAAGCVYIPFEACRTCQDKGRELTEEARLKPAYAVVVCNNRPDDTTTYWRK